MKRKVVDIVMILQILSFPSVEYIFCVLYVFMILLQRYPIEAIQIGKKNMGD